MSRGGPTWGGSDWRQRVWKTPKPPRHDEATLARLEAAVDEANDGVASASRRYRVARIGTREDEYFERMIEAQRVRDTARESLEAARTAARADGTLVPVPEESNHAGELTVKGTEEGTR